MGSHIIIECEGQHAHLSQDALASVMKHAAKAAGATVLSSHFHGFGCGLGITGVLVLAESHITRYTPGQNIITLLLIFLCAVNVTQKKLKRS